MCVQRLLFIFSTFCSYTVINGQTPQMRHYMAVRNVVPEGSTIGDFSNVISNTDCIRRCQDFSTCHVISFSMETKMCRFYSWLNVTFVLTDGSTEKVWRHKDLKMINTRHAANTALDHTEAAQMCEDMGGRLTTVPEIYSIAGDNEFNMCRCGWVTGQASIRLLVLDSSTCEGAKMNGVNVCKNISSAPYAYCTFE